MLLPHLSCRPRPLEIQFFLPSNSANIRRAPDAQGRLVLFCHPKFVEKTGFGGSANISNCGSEKRVKSTVLDDVQEWQHEPHVFSSEPQEASNASLMQMKKRGVDHDKLFRKIAQMFPYTLDSFQSKAIHGILEGKSVVVCAPTGAGKTAIAEAAAVVCLQSNTQIIYTTPLKALSNQKVFEFQERFGREKVGLVTGDASHQPHAPIVVMTTEILRNIMYAGGEDNQDRLADVKVIVLDEVHYLGDPNRGTVWEEVIAGCPTNIQMVCMSATVLNPSDLGSWIAKIHGPCKTIVTMDRPVPLEWHFAYSLRKKAEIDALFKDNTKINPKILPRLSRSGQPIQIVPSMEAIAEELDKQDFLPAIVFVFSRKACDLFVIELLLGGFSFTSKYEAEMIRHAVEKLRGEQPEAVRHKLVKALTLGIASHHAGCLPGWKALVESLFQNGLIRIVFATETLAAGINMPARTTLLTSISRRIPEGRYLLTHNQILQMAGRAGRRGYDVIGNCIICQSRFDMPQEAVERINQGPEPLVSQFKSGYSLVLNLLAKYTLEEAKTFVRRSFRNFMAEKEESQYENQIKEMQEKADPLRAKADKLRHEKNNMDELVVSRSMDVESELSSLRESLEKKREERAAYIKATLLEQGKFPSIVQLNTSEKAQQIGNQIPGLFVFALAFAFAEDEEQVVCLGIEGSLYRVPLQSITSIYDHEVDATDFMFRLEERLRQVNAQNRWSSWGATTSVARGNVHLSGIAYRVLRKTSKEQTLVQFPKCERLSNEIEAYIEKCKELEDDHSGFRKKSRSMKRKSKNAQRRLKTVEKQLARTEKLKSQVSNAKNSDWIDFQGTMSVLIAAGALTPESHEILPLGRVAQEIHGANELWLAMALSHPATSLLGMEDLAAFVAALVAFECVTKPDVLVRYPPSNAVMQIVGQMDDVLDDLLDWEMEYAYASEIMIDPRLSGIVSAWAQGCTWDQVMDSTSLEDGDMCRLLTRTVDLLHQTANSSQLQPTLKSTARKAYLALNRRPIKEVIL